MAEKPKEQPKTSLNKKELEILSQVLFNSKWSGQEWQQIITPLINKLAKMVDETK